MASSQDVVFRVRLLPECPPRFLAEAQREGGEEPTTARNSGYCDKTPGNQRAPVKPTYQIHPRENDLTFQNPQASLLLEGR